MHQAPLTATQLQMFVCISWPGKQVFARYWPSCSAAASSLDGSPASHTVGGFEPAQTFFSAFEQSVLPKPLSAQLQTGALAITVGGGAGAFAGASATGAAGASFATAVVFCVGAAAVVLFVVFAFGARAAGSAAGFAVVSAAGAVVLSAAAGGVTSAAVAGGVVAATLSQLFPTLVPVESTALIPAGT